MSATTTEVRRSHSLKRRLLASMAAAFLLLLLLISVLLWNYSRAAANRTYDLLLAGAALSVLERVSYNSAGPTVDLPQSAMDILALAADDRVAYRVFSPNYGELTGTPDLPVPDSLQPSIDPVFYDARLDEGFRFVFQGRQITSSRGREWVFVQIGQTLNARTAQRDALFLYGMIGLGAVSLIGLGFVWLAIRTSLAPLRAIADTLMARTSRDLSPIEGDPPLEVSDLFRAINSFIAQLVRSRNLTESFIADVAHQTRTSLSALQGQLSLAADAKEFDRMRDRLGKAEKQAERTVHLTNQLLANAMVIHRSEDAQLEPMDLRKLVRDTLAELLRERRLRQVSISFDDAGLPEGEAFIRGDAISIREALRNLIDNAVRHGGPENTILIEIDADEHVVRLTVSDAGPGIARADLVRATERFTSISSKTAGSGLGLAIVRSVAEGHGARLQLGSSVLGGLRATIVFPRLLAISLACLLLSLPANPASARELGIHAATDPGAMQPLVDAFEAQSPGWTVTYREYQTVDLYREVLDADPETRADVIISSAMDLQVELVNRGLARTLRLPSAILPPDWARWRSQLFGFTWEPAAIIYDKREFDEKDLPTSHRDLASFIRENEAKLRGEIGGYDLRRSGIGYLFATQDTIQSVQAQRLTEVLTRANAQSFCCTSDMLDAIAAGKLSMALNVIGSYAMKRDPGPGQENIGVHFLEDYNLVMSRTAWVPKTAPEPEMAERFVAFLLSAEGQSIINLKTPLIPLLLPREQPLGLEDVRPAGNASFLPIRLGPGLLTFLDQIKSDEFLRSWASSMGDQDYGP
ncbi:extracellular solute-binding protein [uncultured Salipiger sp.]|uniref:sensor histidine kinase n=1 Tax=uncultured Salipiger sp. TaxID=499810 RepID=UPI002593E1C3|nr:extracellular solute-binding protein [uncultured Salipiger sp.]